MKIYLSELKKLCASRILIGMFAALLLLNAVCAAVAARPSPAETAAREAYAQYRADPAATDAYYAHLKRLSAEHAREEFHSLPHTFSAEADDLLVLSVMYERVDFLAGYTDWLDRTVKAAENRIPDLRAYGYREDSYEIRAQRRIVWHYENLYDALSPTDAYAHGYDDYLAYPLTAILVALFVTVSVAYIYTGDRACGFDSVLRTTPGGHWRTALAKLGATATVTVAATLLLSLAAFGAMGGTVGYSTPVAAVQTLPLCVGVPYGLTIGAYLILHGAFLTLAMLTYAGLIALVASLKVSYVGCLGVGTLFWAGNNLLFAYDYLGTPPAVRFLNFVSLAEGNTLIDMYRSVNVFGYPVAHPTVLCTVALLLSVVFSFLAAWIFVKDFHGGSLRHRHPVPWFSLRKKDGVSPPCRPRRACRSLVGCELQKIRFGWLGLGILLLLGAKSAYTSNIAGNMERYDEALYYDYITTLQSMEATDRADYIIDERTRIHTIMADYPTKTQAYERGEMSHEDYAAAVDVYYAARARDGVFRRVEHYIASLEAHDRLTGRESDILYTTGLTVFLGFPADLFFCFALWLLSVGVFAVEYRHTSSVGASASLIRTTPRGRGSTFAAKLGICIVSGGLLALLFRAVGLFIVSRRYILPAPDATVSSVPGFSGILSNMSIGEYLLLDFTMQALVGILLGALTGALSCLCRRPLPILSAVLLLSVVPELLTTSLFPQAHGLSLLSLTTPQKLFLQSVETRFLSLPGAWMALVCLLHTILVTGLVLLAHRIYAGFARRIRPPRKEPTHDPLVSKHS